MMKSVILALSVGALFVLGNPVETRDYENQVNWYSDNDCENYIGSTAAGLPPTPAPEGAAAGMFVTYLGYQSKEACKSYSAATNMYPMNQ
jgi:hypothetical protein